MRAGCGQGARCPRGARYLLLLGVELEALVQRAAGRLLVRLLLQPHALGVLHHLLLDVPEKAAWGKGDTDATRGVGGRGEVGDLGAGASPLTPGCVGLTALWW